MIENILGLIYNVCFICCFWPQIYKSLKTKSVNDVSIMLCWMSITGYCAALIYALLRFGFDTWLCVNYILSGISVVVMIVVYYKTALVDNSKIFDHKENT